jgi:hypothetical protein
LPALIWTNEEILRISPDALTYERAKDISTTRHWKELIGNEHFIAGECQSTGHQIYKTCIELDAPQYYCSCQSTKRPCKHAIALLLIFLEKAHLLKITDRRPEWLSLLKEKKDQIQAQEEEKAAQRAVQKAKTLDARFELMEAGVNELETWLFDFIRQGVAISETQSESFWDDFAARMVDAKLGAIGKRIRLLKQQLRVENWYEKILEELSTLYLFVRAFKKLNHLSEEMHQELLNFAGVTIKKDELVDQKGLEDTWLVIGQTFKEEERLYSRRTWLLGENSGRAALILDFSYGQPKFPMEWKTGQAIDAEMVYFPAAHPVRAVIKKFTWSKQPFEKWAGFDHFEKLAQAFATIVAKNPWINRAPALLEAATPIMDGDELFLVDEQRKMIQVMCDKMASWKLLAISGGQAIALFGEYDGKSFWSLSAITDGRIVKI